MEASQETFDFIVAGGGHAACVLASRISRALPSYSILLVEAGPNAHDDSRVLSPLGGPLLHNTELEWNYKTAPQRSLDGRQLYHCSGRLLSGSSAVNYGMWTRGHEEDFNELSRLVGDKRWTYEGMLPYFKRTETHFQGYEETSNPDEHGFTGPIHTVSILHRGMTDVTFSQLTPDLGFCPPMAIRPNHP